MEILDKFKKKEKVNKIGFSLYYPEELECLIENNMKPDIIQIPYNLFDQRFNPYFPLLKREQIEVHVRSVFLQGLFFKNPQELKGIFVKIKQKLMDLVTLSGETDIPVAALCINFAIGNECIDKVILGVDNVIHFNKNMEALEYQNKVKNVYDTLLTLKEDDEDIMLPINWKI